MSNCSMLIDKSQSLDNWDTLYVVRCAVHGEVFRFRFPAHVLLINYKEIGWHWDRHLEAHQTPEPVETPITVPENPNQEPPRNPWGKRKIVL